MNKNTQNTGVMENVTETVVSCNPAPNPVETVVKRLVGRPVFKTKMYLANEDGTPKLGVNNLPIRAGKGKPSPKNHYIWMIPPAKNAVNGVYTPATKPVKVAKVVAPVAETPAEPVAA